MSNKQIRIEELKTAMDFEVKNNFPNGNLWNELSDELDELQKVPSDLEILMMIMNSPRVQE